MKIKVCGMKYPKNIKSLAELSIDYMGLIFYPKSLRYIQNLEPSSLNILPSNIKRVGVFVNEEIDFVLKQIERYNLNQIQLHGSESPQYCLECSSLSNVEIIKAFNVSSIDDLEQAKHYETVCHYFLFDTKTTQHGGSGVKFDWSILDQYKGNTPFFLSGGISIEDIEMIKKISHSKLVALDLNSKFEVEPALKNIELLQQFVNQIKI